MKPFAFLRFLKHKFTYGKLVNVRALKIGIFVSLSPSIRPVFGQYSISKCSRTEISSAKCIITAPSAHVCSALKAWWPFADIVTGKKVHLDPLYKKSRIIQDWAKWAIIYLNHYCERLIKPKIFSISMQASAAKNINISM